MFYLYSFRIYHLTKRTHKRSHSQDAPAERESAAPPTLKAAPFPQMWPILAWYELVSTVWMYYAVVKYLVPNFLNDERPVIMARAAQQVKPDAFSLWSYFTYFIDHRHCIALERFLMVRSTRNLMGTLMTCVNVFWRLMLNHRYFYFRILRIHPPGRGGHWSVLERV